ncbi:hypothetical protein Q8A67_016222 [Cirrhinus molitorella]|uniref:Uncharacterized protein n=1 Tax=Cirrhinus molitorella TaxID=172907 RepID=A0AA88PJP3_9TELE|nr:hypothetical protein Q8A67_016222 [Cirrhinus molitorella]
MFCGVDLINATTWLDDAVKKKHFKHREERKSYGFRMRVLFRRLRREAVPHVRDAQQRTEEQPEHLLKRLAEDREEDQDAFDVLPTAGDTGIWNIISEKCNI